MNERYLDQPKQWSAQESSNRTIRGQQLPSHKCREKRKRKAVEKKIMTIKVANYPAQRLLRNIGQPRTGPWL